MAKVTEIASGVYRINVVLPDRPVSYSLFLIDDDSPSLIETSFSSVFDEVKTAVESVVDLNKIERIVVPHFEGDECGGLNKFLAAAPNAVAVCSPIGASSIRDFTGKEPLVMPQPPLFRTKRAGHASTPRASAPSRLIGTGFLHSSHTLPNVARRAVAVYCHERILCA